MELRAPGPVAGGRAESFSPLLIGEWSGTRAGRLSAGRRNVFQSPTDRGVEWNPGAQGQAQGERLIAFSPLLIGEWSGTRRSRATNGVPSSNFQSPTDRGVEWNASHQPGKALVWRPFSPLLIGEWSGTTSADEIAQVTGIFQSPTDRGVEWNCSTLTGSGIRGRTFSPLLIGEWSGTLAVLELARPKIGLSVPY